MTATSNKLAFAALTGLLSIGLLSSNGASAETHSDSAANTTPKMEKNACKGKNACKSNEGEKEKHSCKGLNSCRGQGADGINGCKGHGSCATDGSKDNSPAAK